MIDDFSGNGKSNAVPPKWIIGRKLERRLRRAAAIGLAAPSDRNERTCAE